MFWQSILHIIQFKFLLYNVLHSVGNIYWRTFLKGRLLLPTDYKEQQKHKTFITAAPNATQNQIKQM